jgi:parallel beta-helix repeat protein
LYQPFETIAGALAEARAGDTVEILPGEYHEHLQLKSGVTLRSRTPHQAVLRAPPLAKGPAVTAQGLTGGRLSGLWIRADEDAPLTAGILLENSSVEIDESLITGAGIGVEIRGSGTSMLRGNEIRNSQAEGVLISGTATPWLSHNTFQGNRGPAVRVREAAKPTLLRNVFDNTTVEGVPAEALRERNFVLEAPKKGPGKKK